MRGTFLGLMLAGCGARLAAGPTVTSGGGFGVDVSLMVGVPFGGVQAGIDTDDRRRIVAEAEWPVTTSEHSFLSLGGRAGMRDLQFAAGGAVGWSYVFDEGERGAAKVVGAELSALATVDGVWVFRLAPTIALYAMPHWH